MLPGVIYFISGLYAGVLLKIIFGIKNPATENSMKTIESKEK